MNVWETIGFIALCVVFFVLVICVPLLIEYSLKSTVPFKVEKVYDVIYDDGILTFKTKTKQGEHIWKFRGDCTVWYWRGSNKRCTTMEEVELAQIWEIARVLNKNKKK